MKPYTTFRCSVQGATHIRGNIPMQDASAVVDRKDHVIGVVSDGHGDPRCMRSEVGAQLAVRLAVKHMEELRRTLSEKRRRAAFMANPDRSMSLWWHGLLEAWQKACMAHYAEHPLTDDERKAAADYLPVYERGEKLYHIYGATLIAALMTRSELVMVQQGDGHAVVIGADKTVSWDVIPWDERCVGNRTTSLSSSDAADSARYRMMTFDKPKQVRAPIAVILGTDGVEDSFASKEGVFAYYGHLCIRSANRKDKSLALRLPDELSQMSQNGSGDDISVVGIANPQAAKTCATAFDAMEESVHWQLQRRMASDHLSSMRASLARKEQVLQEVRKKRQANKKDEEALAELERREADMADFRARMQGWEDRLKEAEENLHKLKSI